MREYELMFNLNEADTRRKILGCGDGPASFNAEMTAGGSSVISCDPIYLFSVAQIQEQFDRSVEIVLSQVRAKPQNYVWSYHRDPDHLRRNRQAVLRRFAADYRPGVIEGRYIAAALPKLPFVDGQFDLALCSHLLFLYSELLSFEFHLQSILELCRAAREIRIFPLVGLNCEPSPHVQTIKTHLLQKGFRVEIVKVAYQLQKKGDQMMRITAAQMNESKQKLPAKAIPRSTGHHKEWLEACKGGKPAGSNFDYGGPLTELALLGIIAIRMKGQKLEWDGPNMKFTNSAEANQYIQQPYRQGWSL